VKLNPIGSHQTLPRKALMLPMRLRSPIAGSPLLVSTRREPSRASDA
jgi:hypothetical protein